MLGEAVHTVDLRGVDEHVGVTGSLPLRPGLSPRRLAPDRLHRRPSGAALRRRNRRALADLADAVPANLGDMVVDDPGRAYVGSQAREGGVIVRIDPDDTVTVVADRTWTSPMAWSSRADGTTLIVAESIGRRIDRIQR